MHPFDADRTIEWRMSKTMGMPRLESIRRAKSLQFYAYSKSWQSTVVVFVRDEMISAKQIVHERTASMSIQSTQQFVLYFHSLTSRYLDEDTHDDGNCKL